MSAVDVVTVERRGAVTTLTLNREESHNALNSEVLASLQRELAVASRDPSVRVVVITGAGQKAFCAGADLKELHGLGPAAALDHMRFGQEVLRTVDESPIPVVAAVNGLALGGGFELALACTLMVMSTKAALALPEAGLGLIPGYGGTQRLPRLVGAQVATFAMLTGERISPDRAYSLGVTAVAPVEPGALMAKVHALADRIAEQGPQAVRSICEAVRLGADASLPSALALETGLAAIAVSGDESTEGVSAFLDRRRPVFLDRPAGEGQ